MPLPAPGTQPENLPYDLRDVVAELIVEIDQLRSAMAAHQRDQTLHPRRPFGVPAEDLDALHQRLATRHAAPLSLHDAKAQFGAATVDAAIAARKVFRKRPEGGAVYLSVDPPRPSSIDVAAYLRESVERYTEGGPQATQRTYATLSELSNVFNRNNITRAVEDALTRGEIVQGTVITSKPGRPPRAVGLKGEPLPTHVDGLPVKWQS